MPAKLFCKTGPLAGAEHFIAAEATIGKNLDNSIVLYPKTISGRHARLFFDEKGKCYFLEDLGSRNGTKLDAMPVTHKEKLGKLHVITFAETFDFIFHLVEKAPAGEEKITQAAPAKPVREERDETKIDLELPVMPQIPLAEESTNEPVTIASMEKTIVAGELEPMPAIPELPQSPPVYFLEFENLKGQQQTFSLKEGENTVGRSMDCDIYIEDLSLSRPHAAITVKVGTVTIKDFGSKNYTFVDQQRITSEIELQPDAAIKFGLVEARLRRKT